MKVADYERYLRMSRRDLLKGGAAMGAMAAAGAVGFNPARAFADAQPISADEKALRAQILQMLRQV